MEKEEGCPIDKEKLRKLWESEIFCSLVWFLGRRGKGVI